MDGIQALLPPQQPSALPMAPDDPMFALSSVLQSLTPSDIESLRALQEELLQLDEEELADLSDMLDFVESNPDQIGEVIEMVGADTLPAEAAPGFVKLLNAVVKTIVAPASMSGMPQGFAMGGPAFGNMMSKGRNGDTMLAHITPGEAHLLRARGGSGTINPATGLPEFFIKKAFKSVKKVFKKVAPTVLPIALNFIPGVGPIAAAALGAGLGTMIQGGSVNDALRNAAIGGLTGAAFSGARGVMQGQGFMAGVRGGLPTSLQARLPAAAAAAPGAPSSTAPLMSPVAAADAPFTAANLAAPSGSTAPLMSPVAAADAPFTAANLAAPPGSTAPSVAPPKPGVFQRAKDFYQEKISPSRPSIQADTADVQIKQQKLIDKFNISPEAAYDRAQKELAPSLLRQYGPLAATGAGIMALSGGFKAPEQEGEIISPFGNLPHFSKINPMFQFAMPPQHIAPPPQYTQQVTARPAGFAMGGAPRMNGAINGPGTGTSDSIPARLSDGEFVFTARAVRGAGNGSRKRGIDAMYEMMRNFERNA